MPRTTTVLLPDVNVLLAGFRTDHIHHRPARAFLEEARSQTVTLGVSDVALGSLVRLCRELGLRGNLVPDAYLAALALEQRAELVTFDRGFGRYPRLRWRCLLDV
jgi:predicted nucleic acid-binding protein